MSTSLLFKSTDQLAEMLSKGQLTSVELVNTFYLRMKEVNASLNAIVISNEHDACHAARKLDEERQDGKARGRWHGIPVTLKESFNLKGHKTTVNFKLLKENVATEDAVLIERLKTAGAIILGKTNVPTLLSDNQSFGPIYPTANNPFDVQRTPGGSTGGGAAALAAGLSPIEFGTDIGGSIRNPSNFCGLFGLKPTENQYVQAGHVPPLPGSDGGYIAMASVGPLARTMTDIEAGWETINQPQWRYLNALPVRSERKVAENLSGYKIAWFDEMDELKCSGATKTVLGDFLNTLKAEGASIQKLSLDYSWLKETYEIWTTLFGFITGQNAPWIFRQIMKWKFRQQAKGSSFDSVGALSKGLGLNFKVFSRTLKRKQEVTAQLIDWFDEYDFIISPTSYGPAFHHNHSHKPISYEGASIPYTEYNFPYTLPYNVCGNPVLVVPAGREVSGLPIGLQIAAPHHAERELIHFGKLVEELGFKFKIPEEFKV